jgi:hypothetical protein
MFHMYPKGETEPCMCLVLVDASTSQHRVSNQASPPSEPKSPSDTVEVSSPTISHVTEIGRFRDAAERELSA